MIAPDVDLVNASLVTRMCPVAVHSSRRQSSLSRHSSLKFVVVDEDSAYIRKIAAAISPDSGIELVTESTGIPGKPTGSDRLRLCPEEPVNVPTMPKPWEE